MKKYITKKKIDIAGSKITLYWTGFEGEEAWSTDINKVGIHNGGMFEDGDGLETVEISAAEIREIDYVV